LEVYKLQKELSNTNRCTGIAGNAFENMSDYWTGLTSVKDLSLSFIELATLKQRFLFPFYRCDKLNDEALENISKTIGKLSSLQIVCLYCSQ